MIKKKIGVIVIILFILLIIVSIILFSILLLRNKDSVSDFDGESDFDTNTFIISKDPKKFDYHFYFSKDDSEPLIYYNDIENNATYIRVCTFNDNIKAETIVDEYGNKVKNFKDLIYSIDYNNGRLIIKINDKKGIEAIPHHYESLEGELIYREGDKPSDVEFYIKANNLTCKEVILQVKDKKYKANSSKPKDSNYVIEKLFELNKREKYISICSNGKFGLIDRSGNVIIDFISEKEIIYKDDRSIINKNNLDYLADIKGNIISEGYENLAFMTNYEDGLRDYFNSYVFIVEPCDKNIQLDERLGLYYDNENGQAYERKFGLIDKNGKLIAPTVYDRYAYIFYDVKFRFIRYNEDENKKMASPRYIITDLYGNRLNNYFYKKILRTDISGYFIADVERDNILTNQVLINPEGKEISRHYKEGIHVANTKISLFEFKEDKLIVDKNGNERMVGLYIDNKYRESTQPMLSCYRYKDKEVVAKIDGVDILELFGKDKLDDIKLTLLTENEVHFEDKNGQKHIIKEGNLII